MPVQIDLKTEKKEQLIDITQKIQSYISDLKIHDGIAMVYVPHTTAAVTINENADPDVVRDIIHGMKSMVPDIGFKHAEGNSPAHIKSSIMGFSEQLIISRGRLVLGTWQGIYFCEFDGPRHRKFYVKFISK